MNAVGSSARDRTEHSLGAAWDATSLDNWFVRLGLASILLVNALAAYKNPADFQKLLGDNHVGQNLPSTAIDLLVGVAALNDMVLGLCVLFLPYRRLVFFWVAAWFLVVAGTKSMNLIW